MRGRSFAMADRDPQRLKNYVEILKRAYGGIEPLMQIADDAARHPSGLETGAPAVARDAMESVERGRDLAPLQYSGLEALIAEEVRPAFDIIDGTFKATHR